VPAWLRYTLIRLVLFVVPLAVLLFLGVFWLWAALVATVVAFCLSFIFLRGQRAAVATDWANRRPRPTRDDEAEDAEIDAAQGGPAENPAEHTAANPAEHTAVDPAERTADESPVEHAAEKSPAENSPAENSAGESGGDEGRAQA
jgi:hypothetical protein